MLSQGKYYLIVLLLCLTEIASAQNIAGTVFDKDDKKPISYATVSNRRTKQVVYTDMFGKFKMDAQFGDTIFVAHPAYEFTSKVIMRTGKDFWVYAERKKHELEEVEILSDMAKFQKDSADRHIIYRKTFQDAGQRPSMNMTNGIGMDGLFSSLALWISGKRKKSKEFTKMVITHEKAKFIGLKYNPELVTQQTGLSEEEAMNFMMDNPMPYDYARAASDLEIKMWIRTNYREWIKKNNSASDSLNRLPDTKR